MRKENREKEALKQGPSDGGLKVIRISFIKWAAKLNIHLLVKSNATLCLNFLELIGRVVWHFNSSLSGQQFLRALYFILLLWKHFHSPFPIFNTCICEQYSVRMCGGHHCQTVSDIFSSCLYSSLL